MARMGRSTAAIVLALAACGDYAADYPSLLPTDQLTQPPALPAHAADAAYSPDATNAQLGRSGDSVRNRAAGTAGTGDLAERARALRERAGLLARTPVGQDAAPPCPEGQADCPPADD